MTQYELLYIVPARFTEDELAPIKQKVREIIENAGGKISLEDSLGKKKLSYPIRKFFQAYYLLNHFELDKSKLVEIDKNLKLIDEIMRSIVVNYEPKTAMKIEKIKEGLKNLAEGIDSRDFDEPRPKKIIPKEIPKEEEKVNIEELDKKLDEILKTDDLL